MTKAPPATHRISVEVPRDMPLPPPVEPEVSYKRLFETSQDGIFVLDFHTHRIVEVNPAM
ncbi:MAG: PAS domain-containing protein, partial [Spartobacteria bacterium]